MTLEVNTKDAAAVSDSELVEMADTAACRQRGFEIGFLSKQREHWVLSTCVLEQSRLRAWSFYSLERIGGTPCLLIGVAFIESNTKSEQYLLSLLGGMYKKAVLAFPDEDVLVGTRIRDARAFICLSGLDDIIPSPGHKPSGEERAWGRRLAKRFGADSHLDDRSFITQGSGETDGFLDFEGPKVEIDPTIASQLDDLDLGRGDSLVVFGWAMTEELQAGKLGK